MEKKLMIGIDGEFQGEGVLWMDFNLFAEYAKDNLEIGDIYHIEFQEMTEQEIAELPTE